MNEFLTVGELIDKLSTFDRNLQIECFLWDADANVEPVNISSMYVEDDCQGYVNLAFNVSYIA